MGIREGQSEQIDMIMTSIWLINESIQCGSMLRYIDYYEKNNMISELQSERVTCRFRASLKHKYDGQTKFIKPNSQRRDRIIKYWVSIGSIHREQG